MTFGILKSEISLATSSLYLPFFISWTDLKARYRRSFLGPVWNVLTILISVVGLSLVWSEIFKIPKSQIVPSLSVGVIFWNFISSCFTEAPQLFIVNNNFLKNVKISTFTLSLSLFFKHILNLAHSIVIIVLILLFFYEHLTLSYLLVFPGFFIVCLNLLWMIQFLGFLGARYRDLSPLISSIMPLLFFFTPVLYQVKQLGSTQKLMAFNPFYHLLSIVRDPLVGGIPSTQNYIFCLSMIVFGWFFTFWITEQKRNRLVYWI